MDAKKSRALQYWLYSVINSKYGKTATMERSSLSYRYAVNRYEFELVVDGLDSKTLMEELASILVSKCGYTKTSASTYDKLDTRVSMHYTSQLDRPLLIACFAY